MPDPVQQSVLVVGPAAWNTIVGLDALPEPRSQTLFAHGSLDTLGGTSAGKALHLADLGVPVTLATVLGDDDHAVRIRTGLTHPLIRLQIEVMPGASERHVNLMTPLGERVSIYLQLPEPPDPAPPDLLDAVVSARHLVLDLSTRARGLIPTAATCGATIWTDLHDWDGHADYHRPFAETADYVFLSGAANGPARPLMERLIAGRARTVVCTLGAAGAVALDAGLGWLRVPAVPVPAVDTNGAGDGFAAGFLAATLRGAHVAAALEAGAAQAARAVGSPHLSPLLEQTPPPRAPR